MSVTRSVAETGDGYTEMLSGPRNASLFGYCVSNSVARTTEVESTILLGRSNRRYVRLPGTPPTASTAAGVSGARWRATITKSVSGAATKRSVGLAE
jgi:hypothetical protein